MNKERSGLLQIGGQDVTVIGDDVKPGERAALFWAHTQKWERVEILGLTKGKVRIIAALPSISTGVCDRETRRFNEEAAGLGDGIAIITISADLPYSLASWCGAAGIEKVMMVSDHYDTSFGIQYGCLVKERRILRRAVFVIDAEDNVVYTDYMASLGDEPDYAAVLQAAKAALK